MYNPWLPFFPWSKDTTVALHELDFLRNRGPGSSFFLLSFIPLLAHVRAEVISDNLTFPQYIPSICLSV